MITVADVSLAFSGQTLFKNVDLKLTQGNCYGIIGANGAGKSTFLRILSGELEPSTGSVTVSPNERMSVLRQDHFAFDEYPVLDTVIMGNRQLYDVQKEREELYAKEDFSDEDGMRAAELEGLYAELGGWEAESDASRLVQGLGLEEEILTKQMSDLQDDEKVKILLAQALFGNPDIILLDEPTNGLDAFAVEWLEDFLAEYEGLVLIVSHDRHFLNNVCTNIIDIDYGKIKLYVGNYEFWYESSQLIQKLTKAQNRRTEEKIAELQSFIARFSANKSKSRQATSRKKLLDKLTVEELPASSRRYPFVSFSPQREVGKEVLEAHGLCKTAAGEQALKNLTFRLERTDKVCFLSENQLAVTELFKIITEETQPDSGSFKWGGTTSHSYFPKDNSEFFDGVDKNLLDWMRQYTENDDTETYVRSFLGRMLFSGDEVFKPVSVLSGGERVRCMLSRMMLFGSNVLILDQPTNHLDLESITAVNNALRDFKGVVLFTSHDHEFIQTVANRIIEITPDGCIDRRCTYDEYLEYKKNQG
ncbi:MAG: ATP-binding cassette domain-containing protein [Clostridia bacterium]|nr:ATP-binding cassette domain-containing protein [Clostridia bacterium]